MGGCTHTPGQSGTWTHCSVLRALKRTWSQSGPLSGCPYNARHSGTTGLWNFGHRLAAPSENHESGHHSIGSSTEVIVQMERASDVSVQVRGPRSEDRQCFFLLEEVLGVIDQVG